MIFELLDGYLLDGTPSKPDLVKTLLAKRSDLPESQPYYEGMRMLGARTPDLALLALRLVLSRKKADDASVVELRRLADLARSAGPGGSAERAAYLAFCGTE